MKKTITILLVIVILFNYIFSTCVFAEESEESPADTTSKYSMDKSQIDSMIEDGKTTDINGNETEINFGKSMVGTMVGLSVRWLDVIPKIIHVMATVFAISGGYVGDVGEFSQIPEGEIIKKGAGSIAAQILISVEQIVFGRYFLFNVDYTITSENIEEKVASGDILTADLDFTKTIASMRDQVFYYYYLLRLIAIVISLLTLIYIGIRMATSTVASDQAKYKKMFVGWCESFVIIFILHYIIVVILKFNTILMNWAVILKDTLIAGGGRSFEPTIIGSVFSVLQTKGGFTVAAYALVYWFLVFMQLKFFILYMRRVFVIAFLIIISPLITVTYSIDKSGDGKAQAFSNWAREFLVTVFIQPLHAFTYLVFMFLAGGIAESAPVFALVFIYGLSRIEKIVKVIFNMGKVESIKDFKDMMKGK